MTRRLVRARSSARSSRRAVVAIVAAPAPARAQAVYGSIAGTVDRLHAAPPCPASP